MAKNGTLDLSSFSVAELQAAMDAKKQAQAALVRERGLAARKDVEAYCLSKHGMSLQAIFTASDRKLVTYKHPTTGATYAGRGKKPAWLVGHEQEYAVQ